MSRQNDRVGNRRSPPDKTADIPPSHSVIPVILGVSECASFWAIMGHTRFYIVGTWFVVVYRRCRTHHSALLVFR
jgi:hypothetical protein